MKLRYYQKKAIDKFFVYTAENHGKHPIVSMPTGSGKSLVQAHIVKKILDYPDTRILLLTHQQELIMQNYSELVKNFNHDMFLDIGIYSAGLNRRDTENRILFAGIQSAYGKAEKLGFFDLILVDECHRINTKQAGIYRKFLADMEEINPKIVIGGLSATPFRMKGGFLHDGKDSLFDDICYNVGIPELIDPNHFKNIDKKQYLCDIVSRVSEEDIDISGVRTQAGEYVLSDQEKVFNTKSNVEKAIDEILEYTHSQKRQKTLLFTTGIEHCEHVYEELKKHLRDDYIDYVHSKRSKKDNQSAIDNFKNGKLKYLINIDILTTGFNSKQIDCIVMLRATKSPGLYSQIVGRGLRMYPGKENCLFLDYGGNILRHGPIDKIEIKKDKNGKFVVDSPPQKICPECRATNHARVKHCVECNYEFIFDMNSKHDDTASTADVISKYKKPEKYDVKEIRYRIHGKKDKPDSVKVEYVISDFLIFPEWVCLDHVGFARKKALQWVKKRTDTDINTTYELLEKQDCLKKPDKIIVNVNGEFPKIISYIFPKEKTKEEKINEAMEALI